MWFDVSSSGFVAMIILLSVCTIASIALRFWSRAVVLDGDYRLDDWLALAATVVFFFDLAIGLYLAPRGVGKHADELPTANVVEIVGIFWTGCFAFDLGLGLSKLSVLAFYARIFGFRHYTSLAWKLSMSFAAFFTLGWVVAETIFTLLKCSPVLKSWNPLLPGVCVPTLAYLVQSPATNVFNDVHILLLPMMELGKLNMQFRKKAYVVLTLFMGYSVALLSVGRLITMVQLADILEDDFSYAALPLGFWILAESLVTPIAISLPPIFQLCRRWQEFGFLSLFRREASVLRNEEATCSGHTIMGRVSLSKYCGPKDSCSTTMGSETEIIGHRNLKAYASQSSVNGERGQSSDSMASLEAISVTDRGQVG